jgi:hypothetical protein
MIMIPTGNLENIESTCPLANLAQGVLSVYSSEQLSPLVLLKELTVQSYIGIYDNVKLKLSPIAYLIPIDLQTCTKTPSVMANLRTALFRKTIAKANFLFTAMMPGFLPTWSYGLVNSVISADYLSAADTLAQNHYHDE